MRSRDRSPRAVGGRRRLHIRRAPCRGGTESKEGRSPASASDSQLLDALGSRALAREERRDHVAEKFVDLLRRAADEARRIDHALEILELYSERFVFRESL